MSKIIGATVGTTTSVQRIGKTLDHVKTVNGIAPDEQGNVDIPVGGGSGGGGSTFYFTQTAEEDVTAIAFAFPANYGKILQFNIHATFGAKLTEDSTLYLVTGGQYRALATLKANDLALDMYAMYYFNWGNPDYAYYAFGFKNGGTSADTIRPQFPSQQFFAKTNSNSFTMYSNNGVPFPAGTRIEVWGVMLND